MHAGKGSNRWAKLLALWGILLFAQHRHFALHVIMGDSSTIIDWVLKTHTLNSIFLTYWLEHTRLLIDSSLPFQCGHIYREFNVQADTLSKQGLTVCLGKIFWKEVIKDCVVDDGVFHVH